MNAQLPLIADIADPQLTQAPQHKLDHKTKPWASLGRLEQLALRLGQIQGTASPGWSSRKWSFSQATTACRARRLGLPERRDLADGGELPRRWRRRQRAGAPAWPGAHRGGLRRGARHCPREAAPGQPGLLLRKVAPARMTPAKARHEHRAMRAGAANGMELVRACPQCAAAG